MNSSLNHLGNCTLTPLFCVLCGMTVFITLGLTGTWRGLCSAVIHQVGSFPCLDAAGRGFPESPSLFTAFLFFSLPHFPLVTSLFLATAGELIIAGIVMMMIIMIWARRRSGSLPGGAAAALIAGSGAARCPSKHSNATWSTFTQQILIH